MKTIQYLLLISILLAGASSNAEPLFNAVSDQGSNLQINSSLQPLAINQMHSWELRFTDPGGKPITGARVEFQGGMPLHNHGLPTAPVITGEIEPGLYLLEGMRFHMPGDWEISIHIEHEGRQENFTLQLSL